MVKHVDLDELDEDIELDPDTESVEVNGLRDLGDKLTGLIEHNQAAAARRHAELMAAMNLMTETIRSSDNPVDLSPLIQLLSAQTPPVFEKFIFERDQRQLLKSVTPVYQSKTTH